MQAEEAANVCFASETDFRRSQEHQPSRVLSNREEHQQGPNGPSALVFQLVPLARLHGFGRIYRRIPELLVDDRS
jgi:hypothetical protein